MKRNELATRVRRRSIPSHFMLKVEQEELRLLRTKVSAVYGDNSSESGSTSVDYLGDCVLTDREEAVMKALLIRINRRFIAIAGRKSGIPEFWGEGNRGSEAHWILLPGWQKERQTGNAPARETPPEGHIRVDRGRRRGFREKGIVFQLGDIYPGSKGR